MAGSAVDMSQVSLVLMVDPSGTFTADDGRQLAGLEQEPPWHGRIDEELTVEATKLAQAVCGAVERKYTVSLFGKILRKKDELRLELEGKDPACPELGCVFRLKYSLRKG
jgi:hypothetical protein